MDRHVPLCFVIAACLVAVAGLVAIDRGRQHRATRAAVLAPVVVVEPLETTQYSSLSPELLNRTASTAHRAPQRGNRPDISKADGEVPSVPSPQLSAAFFDSVFPTPRVGG